MKERLKKIKEHLSKLYCHRMIYGGLAAAHAAACVGVDHYLVYQALAGLYLLLVVRG